MKIEILNDWELSQIADLEVNNEHRNKMAWFVRYLKTVYNLTGERAVQVWKILEWRDNARFC